MKRELERHATETDPEVPRLLEFAETLIREYGYVLLFAVVLAGVIGFPIPDEGILFFAGVLIAKGTMVFFPVFVTGMSAVVIGSLFNYRIACFGGSWRMARWGKRLGFPIRRWKRTVRVVRKYGVWAVPISYFIPGIRMGVSYAAGLLRIPLPRCLIGTLIGVSGWIGLYLWLGHLVGSRL